MFSFLFSFIINMPDRDLACDTAYVGPNSNVNIQNSFFSKLTIIAGVLGRLVAFESAMVSI